MIILLNSPLLTSVGRDYPDERVADKDEGGDLAQGLQDLLLGAI